MISSHFGLFQIGFESHQNQLLDICIYTSKYTNGFDANTPLGSIIRIGDPVFWTYVVTNTGNVTLAGISVIDDQGVDVACDLTELGPGDFMTCTAAGISVTVQYRNLGTANGLPPVDVPVEASDVSQYSGEEAPSIYSFRPSSATDLGCIYLTSVPSVYMRC